MTERIRRTGRFASAGGDEEEKAVRPSTLSPAIVSLTSSSSSLADEIGLRATDLELPADNTGLLFKN